VKRHVPAAKEKEIPEEIPAGVTVFLRGCFCFPPFPPLRLTRGAQRSRIPSIASAVAACTSAFLDRRRDEPHGPTLPRVPPQGAERQRARRGF
jgi:hypothetical protein